MLYFVITKLSQFVVITNCDSLVYCKKRWTVIANCDSFYVTTSTSATRFIATGNSKCDDYYKLHDSTNQSLLVRWHVNIFFLFVESGRSF